MPAKEEKDTGTKSVEEVLREHKKTNPNVRIVKGSDPEVRVSVQTTGIEPLDALCRGLRCGGFTGLYGTKAAGKSTLMARFMSAMQKEGRKVLLVDLEGRSDPDWLERQGVDTTQLYVLHGGKDFEENINVVNSLIREGVFQGICIDSVTAVASRGEIEDKKGKQKGLEDDTVALLARQLSKWFRQISPAVTAQKIPVVLLSQVRAANIHAGAYLDMTGGNAIKHWCTTIMKISRTDRISATRQGAKVDLGYWMKVEMKKTSINANEGQEVRLPFYFGIGIDDVATTVRAAMQDGIVKPGARGVTFQEKYYASEVQLVTKCRENEELRAALITAVASAAQDKLNQVLTKNEASEPEESQALTESNLEEKSDLDQSVKTPDTGASPPATKDAKPQRSKQVTEPKVEESGATSGETEYVCEDCGQVLKSAHGLKIHRGRTHKDEE